LIKQSWLESGTVYGYRKVTTDLRDQGEPCGKHRVARLMKKEGLRSRSGYGHRPGHYGGKPAQVSPNHLQRQFDVTEPNKVWVTDITYIRTHEGWLYLAVVVDLFSSLVVGWSMRERMTSELALNALLMAVWRRKPDAEVMVHSDQGSQYTSYDWLDFLKAHNLKGSMSRRGNCHDNAVAESFFQLLSASGSSEKYIPRVKTLGVTSLITSKCSTTQNGVTARLTTCLWYSLRKSFPRGCKPSRKAGAIHIAVLATHSTHGRATAAEKNSFRQFMKTAVTNTAPISSYRYHKQL
jgi:transposase InsO family protein